MVKLGVLSLSLAALTCFSALRLAAATRLGVAGERFTINGKPTFLLGFSYYGGLGASEETLGRDLDYFQAHGFNWLRVWATWGGYETDTSAVGREGAAREPYLGRLQRLVAECDRRGMVVDVTLSRGAGLPDLAAHRRAVRTLVQALATRRNWYLDLGNERNIRDARYVPMEDLRTLRDEIKGLAPWLLLTASHAGSPEQEVTKRYLEEAGLDFLAIHGPRDAGCPAGTGDRTRQWREFAAALGRPVPVHWQEPFRRGYDPRHWEPTAQDFAADLRAAQVGGAAGWCFHNGGTRNAPGEYPRRSFDLTQKALCDQLDAEERKFVEGLPAS